MRRQDPSDERNSRKGGFLDFGPLGAGLRRKVIEKWRRFFVLGNGLMEVSTPVITPHRVFDASGHVEHFKDGYEGVDREFQDLKLEAEEIREEIRELLMAEGRKK